jgi:hypothetical protein
MVTLLSTGYQQAQTCIHTIPFCELVSHPEQFDNKVVRTEAVFHVNLEKQTLSDPSCSVGNVRVWAEFADRSPSALR